MDWQPTTNNPLGIYFDAGPVVVGADSDDGGGESLQVTGPTSLDDQTIVTDGGGNLTVQGGGAITLADTTNDVLILLTPGSGNPSLTLQGQVSAGGIAATITLSANKNLSIVPGTDDTSAKGFLALSPVSGHPVIIGTNAAGGSVLRVVGLPTGAGTPPGGLSAGDLWVDTTAGSHQGILKVY